MQLDTSDVLSLDATFAVISDKSVSHSDFDPPTRIEFDWHFISYTYHMQTIQQANRRTTSELTQMIKLNSQSDNLLTLSYHVNLVISNTYVTLDVLAGTTEEVFFSSTGRIWNAHMTGTVSIQSIYRSKINYINNETNALKVLNLKTCPKWVSQQLIILKCSGPWTLVMRAMKCNIQTTYGDHYWCVIASHTCGLYWQVQL